MKTEKEDTEVRRLIVADTLVFNRTDRNFALNSVDAIGARTPELEQNVLDMYERRKHILQGNERYKGYDALMAKALLIQWGLIE